MVVESCSPTNKAKVVLSPSSRTFCVCGGLLHKVKQDALACVLNNNSSCVNDKEREGALNDLS